MTMEDIFGPPISVYTKAQAVEDGDAVEVPENIAREAGFKVPVYLTIGAHAEVEVPESVESEQDYTGRLWDLLYLTAHAFRAGPSDDRLRTNIKVIFRNAPGRDDLVTFWAGIDGDGVTIMLPSEY